MKETLKALPEVFYDFLGMFVPGFLAIFVLDKSPLAGGVLETLKLSAFDRVLILVLAGYAIGHALTALSDVVIRRVWRWVCDDEEQNLLGTINKQKRWWRPPWWRHPRPFPAWYVKYIRKELEQEFKPDLPGESVSDTSNRSPSGADCPQPDPWPWHFHFDLIEQFLKQRDYAAGMLCQKNHALVLFCRNMAVVSLLAAVCFSSTWRTALLMLVFWACFSVRWDYLRIRRAETLYHSFHVTVDQSHKVAAD